MKRHPGRVCAWGCGAPEGCAQGSAARTGDVVPPPALAQGTEGLGDAEPALAVMLLLRVVCCRGCLAPKG